MAIHTMKIIENDTKETYSRIIIEVNGFEIDVLADLGGINIAIQKGNVIHTECAFDYDEKHINEQQGE